MKTKNIFLALMLMANGMAVTSCGDYLDTSSPSNTDDAFVSYTSDETLKVLSRAYAIYRDNCSIGYDWNDHFASDTEYYPEANSSNNCNAKLIPEQVTCNFGEKSFNNLYTVISYCKQIKEMIEAKAEYQEAVAKGERNAWTQMMGEAMTLHAHCYFSLVRHYGDVPYGYEGQAVSDYELSSRFDIYDKLIDEVKAAEPLMYKIGENGMTAERMSRTYAATLVGQMALFSASYQTIRDDVPGLYGDLQFDVVSSDAQRKCSYARRKDYQSYYQLAETYFAKALGEDAGTTKLLTTDDRTEANNPFQLHFQYEMNLKLSSEAIYEIGAVQGTDMNSRTYTYDFGRGCNGGNNTAPNKVFAAIRMIPTFYYGGFAKDDPRRDVSATVTGLDGKGSEVPFTFKPGAKTDGGICLNKWDICRQEPYYYGKQQGAGFNMPVMRVADVILMQAEVKAVLAKDEEALSLVNQIRQRAFGDTAHNLTGLHGEALLDAIYSERKFEMFGEGWTRYDMLRTGKFAQYAMAVRTEMQQLAEDIQKQGYHRFANGNEMPAYIWTKQVEGSRLTFDCKDENDPVEYPGWRGVCDFSGTSAKVTGTDHNTAIKGLFHYIDPNGAEATQLEQEGYTRRDWGAQLAASIDVYMSNILPGIESTASVPCYLFPIPYETLSQSNGKITNGYGLPQQ